MLPATPVPLLVLRLATEHKPWRLPREAGLRLRLINVPVSYGPGEPGLPYAFPALPGRYLADMVELAFQEDWKGPKAILNPALTHHPGTLAPYWPKPKTSPLAAHPVRTRNGCCCRITANAWWPISFRRPGNRTKPPCTNCAT